MSVMVSKMSSSDVLGTFEFVSKCQHSGITQAIIIKNFRIDQFII